MKGGFSYSNMTKEEINSELLGNNPRSQNLEVAENRFEYNSSNPKYVSFMLYLINFKRDNDYKCGHFIWYQNPRREQQFHIFHPAHLVDGLGDIYSLKRMVSTVPAITVLSLLYVCMCVCDCVCVGEHMTIQGTWASYI